MAFTNGTADKFAALPVGTVFQYSSDGTTYTTLPNIRTIGTVGETGTFVDVTPLGDTKTRALAGLSEQPEITYGFLDAFDETDWTTFLTAAQNKTAMKIRIWFPNKRQADLDVALNGYQLSEPSNDSPIEVTVAARQNTIAWTSVETPPGGGS
ncbi:phage protein [Vibrio maritimus]|uniref:Phage protein n=1 Tax=Vibrio maritimus TaxID=990268 RepID=A0A090RT13_9VIBR|nr:phage protein [Vibrio maritimus]